MAKAPGWDKSMGDNNDGDDDDDDDDDDAPFALSLLYRFDNGQLSSCCCSFGFDDVVVVAVLVVDSCDKLAFVTRKGSNAPTCDDERLVRTSCDAGVFLRCGLGGAAAAVFGCCGASLSNANEEESSCLSLEKGEERVMLLLPLVVVSFSSCLSVGVVVLVVEFSP
jgi:hypothetical protein